MQNSILQNAEDPVLRHKLELGPEIAHFSWAFMALNILIYWG